MHSRRHFTLFGLVLWFLLFSSAALSADSGYGEYEVKAAFLYNFAKFVDWPESARPAAGEPFTIGVLGKDPFGPTLETIAKGEIGGRPVKICRIRKPDLIEPCQVLFISPSERKNLPVILKKLTNRPVLTVSDIPGFAAQGGIIEMLTIDRRIRFKVNLQNARDAGLEISSHLLGLAVSVYPVNSAAKNESQSSQ